MINASFKRLIALLLILAFSSQLMAATVMPCELENILNITPVTAHTFHENHSQHMSHEVEPPQLLMNDAKSKAHTEHQAEHQLFCCKTMDHCLLGCALIAINHYFFFQLDITPIGIEDYYSSRSSNPYIPSLYRPPITADTV